MYQHWSDRGVPLGALAAPRPVYQVEGSPRGKYHLADRCVRDLVEVAQIPLTELDFDKKVCRNCAENRSWEEYNWRYAIQNLLSQGEAIDRILDEDCDYSRNIDLKWSACIEQRRLFELRMRHPLNVDIREGRHVLLEWARTELRDRNLAALDRLLAENPAAAAPDWPVRFVAAGAVEDHSVQFGNFPGGASFPALGVACSWAFSRGMGHDGQGKILPPIRDAVAAAVRSGGTHPDCVAAGVAAGKTVLDGEDTFVSREQVPFGADMPVGDFDTIADALTAAWRVAAESEIVRLATGFADKGYAEIREHEASPVEAVLYEVDACDFRHDAAVVHYAAHCLGPSGDVGQLLVCLIPSSLVSKLHDKDRSRARRLGSFGAVLDSDNRETFELALHLVRTLDDVDHAAALGIARDTLLPMSA